MYFIITTNREVTEYSASIPHFDQFAFFKNAFKRY